jgi:hypothetical protein
MSKIETPTIVRRQMFSQLPPEIREKSEAIAIARVQRVVLENKLNAAADELSKARGELENHLTDLQVLESDLHELIAKHVKEAL